MADRWPSRTLPDYNCEVANPASQTTHGYPPVAVTLLVVVAFLYNIELLDSISILNFFKIEATYDNRSDN